ncbi:PEP-utilizing enzyme [Sorangium sp. So ce295]|uniref:PEP-utilizing enzyme n=1 Tax=Sorangium sp. So ce295 TaxID=3133295 RepID=UPI003F5D9BEA
MKDFRACGLIRRARVYLSLREHPKFFMMQLFDRVRRAAREAGAIAVERGLLASIDDTWMLELDELTSALEGGAVAEQLQATVVERRAALARHARMSPPPVITSEGEAVVARRDRRDLPAGALAGVPVSAGVVEGVARVVRDPTREVLRAGEILVAPFTDPGWTPLFLHAAGLVMEVGGLMTHGSVVAREYGIPAVVGVEAATTAIWSGARIRVDGDQGHVVILDDAAGHS